MTVRVDSEEVQTTKSEKLLAVVLAVFLFIGGLWAYQRIDDSVRAAVDVPEASATEQAALDRLGRAQEAELAARAQEEEAVEQLTLAREAYRTSLDAGQPDPELEQAYEVADATHTRAVENVQEAQAAVAAAQPAALAAQDRLGAEQARAHDRRALLTFAFRLLFVLGLVASGYWLLARQRKRGSRYLPLGLAFVGFAAVLALVMAGDYVTDYIDPLALGPLVLALAGIALTIAAFVALQRYLARRLPLRRARKSECPYCGYPARGTEHCEGCGRELVAECARCSRPRRVGTLHCGACGQA